MEEELYSQQTHRQMSRLEVYPFQSAKDKTMHETAQLSCCCKTVSHYCKSVKAISHIITFTHLTHTHSVIHTIYNHMRFHHVQISNWKRVLHTQWPIKSPGLLHQKAAKTSGNLWIFWLVWTNLNNVRFIYPLRTVQTYMTSSCNNMINCSIWCLKTLFVTATDGSSSELPNWLQHLHRKAFCCSSAIKCYIYYQNTWNLEMHY